MLVLGSVPQTDTPMGWYLQLEGNVVARSSRKVTIPKIPNKLNVGWLKEKATQYLKISQGQKQMTGPKNKTTKQSIIRPPFVGTRLPKQNFAFWAKGTRERQAPIAAKGGSVSIVLRILLLEWLQRATKKKPPFFAGFPKKRHTRLFEPTWDIRPHGSARSPARLQPPESTVPSAVGT